MSSTDPDFLAAVRERSVQFCMVMLEGLLDRMIKDGMTYGDVRVSDAEQIPRYLDLRNRGVLDMLPTVAPEIATGMRRDFERAMGKAIVGEA